MDKFHVRPNRVARTLFPFGSWLPGLFEHRTVIDPSTASAMKDDIGNNH